MVCVCVGVCADLVCMHPCLLSQRHGRPVLCLCTLVRMCSQHIMPSHSRSVFSILTYAMGQKTMSFAHALCEPSQSTSFVLGEPS